MKAIGLLIPLGSTFFLAQPSGQPTFLTKPMGHLIGYYEWGGTATGGGQLELIQGKNSVHFRLLCYRPGDAPNYGELKGEFILSNGVGVFTSPEFGSCKITFMIRKNTVEVIQDQPNNGCGFGALVTASGVYTRVARPK